MNTKLHCRCLNCTKVFDVSYNSPVTLTCSQCGSINIEFERPAYMTCMHGHRSYKVIKNFSREPICDRCLPTERTIMRTLTAVGKDLDFAKKYGTEQEEIEQLPAEVAPPVEKEEATSGKIDKIKKPKPMKTFPKVSVGGKKRNPR